jgi:heme/copper-type cytochrome/quinol oxidase subunit 3
MDKKTQTIWLVVTLVTFAPGAYAYIDPGTGQLAWQLILTMGLGVAFSFKRIFQFAKMMLGKVTSIGKQK